MIRGLARNCAIVLAGLLYWQLGSLLTGVAEPWDSDSYWLFWYPLSLILSAIAGPFFNAKAWIGGAAMTLTQLPVMWLNAGADELWVAGLLILCLLAVPAMGVSWLASFIVQRMRRP